MKLQGDVLAALLRTDDAAAAYQHARDSADVYGFLTLLWQIDTARAVLFLAQGRMAEATGAFQSARATIERLALSVPDAAIRDRFHTRALARLLAQAPPEHDPGTAPRLSPRELDVLRLLVEGKSDREIAQALFVSPRTVMRHVAGILAKLEVPSRTAAATFAVRNEIV